MDKNDAQFQLASILLQGFLEENERGRLRQKYLSDRAAQVQEARTALAKLLRSNRLNDQLREELASLFDPDPDSPGWQQRRIKIVSRRRGKRIDHIAATQVLKHVVDAINAGSGVNSAIAGAAETFSISDEMAKQIWRRYHRAFGARIFDVV